MVLDALTAAPHIATGRMRALAVTGESACRAFLRCRRSEESGLAGLFGDFLAGHLCAAAARRMRWSGALPPSSSESGAQPARR